MQVCKYGEVGDEEENEDEEPSFVFKCSFVMMLERA